MMILRGLAFELYFLTEATLLDGTFGMRMPCELPILMMRVSWLDEPLPEDSPWMATM